MSRPKSRIRKALSDAHLKAIGMVAAQWADLELKIMFLIGEESGTTVGKAFAMVAGNGVKSWLVILNRLLISGGKEWKWEEFKKLKLQKTLEDLQAERNNIVHANWDAPTNEPGMLGFIPVKSPPKIAAGLGFKKGSSKMIIDIAYTAAEMRAIAKKIAAADKALLSWSATPSPEQTTQLLAQAVLDTRRKRRSRASPKAPTK